MIVDVKHVSGLLIEETHISRQGLCYNIAQTTCFLSFVPHIFTMLFSDNPRLWNVLSYTLAVCACSDKRDVKQQVFQLLSQILTHPLFLLQVKKHINWC